MSKFHGLDCECCKDKTPGVDIILSEISKIVGSQTATSTQKTLSDLKNLSSSEFSGQLSDIIQLSEAYFSAPLESLSVEQLALTDPEKRVGKFLVKDLCDVPTLDVTKVIDFSKFDVSKFDFLKFSISVPTIEIEKTISFPGVNLGMKFLVNRKGFSWFPVINAGVKTKQEALAKLSGVTFSQPISPSTKFEDAKSIAARSYKTSKEVYDVVASSTNTLELIDKLAKIGVVLTEEISVEAQMKTILEKESKIKNAQTFSDPECGTPGITPAAFDPAEVKEIEKNCCSQDYVPPAPEIGIAESEDQLAGMTSSSPDPGDLENVKKFLADAERSAEQMKDCSTQKNNAANNYYWFQEASFLNQIALEYVTARSKMIDSLNGTFLTLENTRNKLIQRSVKLKDDQSKLIASVAKSLFPASTGELNPVYVLNVGGVNLTQDQLSILENNETYKSAVSSIQANYDRNEKAIQDVTSQIQNAKRNFSLPTFTEEEVLNLKTYGPSSASSVLASKTSSFKNAFSISTNPLTNQIGFTGNSILNLEIHPSIVAESKTLFQVHSPETGDVSDYIKKLTTRRGKLAEDIWNKFYSNNRVDQLFTYQEQGYTSPKPQYDDSGKIKSSTKKVKVVSPTGASAQQAVSKDSLDLKIDQEVALEFWPNLERKTREKLINMFSEFQNSSQYKDYMKVVIAAGENEAKYAYAANLIFQEFSYTNRAFDNYTNSFTFNQANIDNSLVVNLNTPKVAESFTNLFSVAYHSLSSFQDSIQEKITQLENFIEKMNTCLANQEVELANSASRLANKTVVSKGPTRDDCASKLGSDPLGIKPTNGCPGPIKNCYWKEYTKLMQTVSLMPIPDDAATGALQKRLFRYYPVGIQIPVPSPPGVLPTLASGIPDPMISIPLPIVWKHVITITTPLGMFVIWIGVCGPVVGPYVMFIDENMEPCFLVTPKGPISIPAKSLKVSEMDDKSLLEMLSPIKDTFKVPVKTLPQIMGGNNKIKTQDPDDPSNVIDKLQEKIKSALDSLQPDDPWTLGATSQSSIKSLKDRVNRSLRNVPPDIEAINEAFLKIEKVIDKQIDSITVKPIKFPKNPKKLVAPVVGPAEFKEDIEKLLDAGAKLADVGLGIPTISLKKKLKAQLDKELSSPETKEKFAKIDQQISDLEAELRISGGTDREKVVKRVKILKEAISIPAKNVADKITPEDLGFIFSVNVPVPLPVPCYDSVDVEPLPPFIPLMIAVVKELPQLIDQISDEELASKISKSINLTVPLPRIEDSIYFVLTTVMNVVPDLKFPDTASASHYKQAVKAAAQNFFKVKVRMPHPGVPQIIIPSDVVKSAIKIAVKTAFSVVVKMVLSELQRAADSKNLAKVLAVAAIIKGIFGTDLGNVSGNDIKAFIASALEDVDQQLESVKVLLKSSPSVDFKSIKETLFPTVPPKLKPEGPFLEISTEEMLKVAQPLIQTLENVPIPFPVALIAASQLPSRAIMTKIYPFAAKELLPSWEKLTLKNVPFVVWLDQLVATAQRQGGLFSDYVIPYYLPDA